MDSEKGNTMKRTGALLLLLLCIFAAPVLCAATVEELRKDAGQGDVESQYRLGQRYEAGKGVKRDFAKAAEWYGKAARQGNARDQTNLGNL